MIEYIADLETLATDEAVEQEKTHVHTWGIMNQKTKKKEYGSSISQFIKNCEKKSHSEKSLIWFHNLAFDGVFVMDYLARELGFKIIGPNDKVKSKTVQAVIDEMGNYYSITICFRMFKKRKESIMLLDSAKRIPGMSVESMAVKYQLPIKKGKYDYKAYRSENHKMTLVEKEYLDSDLEIVGAVLDIQNELGLKKMTIGSCALDIYFNMVGEKNFNNWFPVLPILLDTAIRESYNGGYTYLNPVYKGKVIKQGRVYDVNSLYPSIMRNEWLPYGYPIHFKGEYVETEGYPLYIQNIKCWFEVKEGYLPTINMDMPFGLGNMKYAEYNNHSYGAIVPLCLTNIDLRLFLEHYNTKNLEYIDGYMFRASNTMFVEYVDFCMEGKIKAHEEGNIGHYQTFKLLANNLYGKFGTKMKRKNKIPSLDIGADRITYSLEDGGIRNPIYTAIASFVTAYGRDITIRTAQANYDRFIYADTDSAHFEFTDIPGDLPIHKNKLGYWKDEGVFNRAKYVRPKAYYHEFWFKKEYRKLSQCTLTVNMNIEKLIIGDTHMWNMKKKKIACSGMTDEIKRKIKFDDFELGSKWEGKKSKKIVSGGVLIVPRPFTI
jgi:DNA polymerase type B, organellar and viral